MLSCWELIQVLRFEKVSKSAKTFAAQELLRRHPDEDHYLKTIASFGPEKESVKAKKILERHYHQS